MAGCDQLHAQNEDVDGEIGDRKPHMDDWKQEEDDCPSDRDQNERKSVEQKKVTVIPA